MFVYDALLEALKSGDTSIPCVEFRQRYEQLIKAEFSAANSPLQDQFEVLASFPLLSPTGPI